MPSRARHRALGKRYGFPPRPHRSSKAFASRSLQGRAHGSRPPRRRISTTESSRLSGPLDNFHEELFQRLIVVAQRGVDRHNVGALAAPRPPSCATHLRMEATMAQMGLMASSAKLPAIWEGGAPVWEAKCCARKAIRAAATPQPTVVFGEGFGEGVVRGGAAGRGAQEQRLKFQSMNSSSSSARPSCQCSVTIFEQSPISKISFRTSSDGWCLCP